MKRRIAQTTAAGVFALAMAGFVAVPGLDTIGSSAYVAEAADGDKKPRRVPNIQPTTWKKLQQVEELVKEDQYQEGLSILLGMLPRDGRKSRYNENELGQIHNTLAYIYWELEQPHKTIQHYEKVIEQVPFIAEATELITLHQLAKLYFMQGQEQQQESAADQWYRRSLATMQDWLIKKAAPGPDPHFFIAQIHYQLRDFAAGIASLETTVRVARERGMKVKQPWWQMLYFMYYDQGNWPRVTDILEILVEEYPKREYWVTLAAVYGETGYEDKQLWVLEAAHVGGYLEKETDIRAYGALLLQNDVPNRASKYIQRGFDDEILEPSLRNLQLCGQAYQVAQDIDDAIECFERAAELDETGRTFDLLASLYLDKDEFDKCRGAAKRALEKGGLSNTMRTEITLATCEFNLGNLRAARRAFVAVRREAREERERRLETMAGAWIKYIDNESKRRDELRRAGL